MERQEAEQFVQRFDQWMTLFLQNGVRLSRECALPPSQLFLARTLKESGPSRVSDIAAALGVSLPAVSSLVSDMVKAGHVIRREIASDRRVTLVHLSAAGEEALHQAEQQRKQSMVALLSRFDEPEIETFLNTLAKLLARLQELYINR